MCHVCIICFLDFVGNRIENMVGVCNSLIAYKKVDIQYIKIYIYIYTGYQWSNRNSLDSTSAFHVFFFFSRVFGGMRLLFMHCCMNSNRKCWLFHGEQLSMHRSRTHKFHFSATFSLKMDSTVLFTHLKNILLQCFQFSVFSF